MRRLRILRHAKSSWADDSLPDHDRPLAPRGRRAASRIAEWVAEHDVRPALVCCSTATRARQTLDRVLPVLGDARVRLEPRLYAATRDELVAYLRDLPEVEEVMLVGHNPGLQELALLLASPSDERDRIDEKLPTGALVTLELDVDGWGETVPGCGRVSSLVLPRELE